MTTYARCTADITVAACNIRTLTGNKGRKPQHVLVDQVLPVERQYTSTSLAHHGDPVLVLARDGYHLHVLAKHFETCCLYDLYHVDDEFVETSQYMTKAEAEERNDQLRARNERVRWVQTPADVEER
jgi:hypothetical protein